MPGPFRNHRPPKVSYCKPPKKRTRPRTSAELTPPPSSGRFSSGLFLDADSTTTGDLLEPDANAVDTPALNLPEGDATVVGSHAWHTRPLPRAADAPDPLPGFLEYAHIDFDDHLTRACLRRHHITHWSYFRRKSERDLLALGFPSGPANYLSSEVESYEKWLKEVWKTSLEAQVEYF